MRNSVGVKERLSTAQALGRVGTFLVGCANVPPARRGGAQPTIGEGRSEQEQTQRDEGDHAVDGGQSREVVASAIPAGAGKSS